MNPENPIGRRVGENLDASFRFAKRPRFHVHFTPTYGSWLNLVERWFAALTEKQLRRGVHRSTRELGGGGHEQNGSGD